MVYLGNPRFNTFVNYSKDERVFELDLRRLVTRSISYGTRDPPRRGGLPENC